MNRNLVLIRASYITPVNSCGYLDGITTASFNRRLALSAAATSLHRTSGFEVQMSRCSDPASSRNSLFRAKIRDTTNTKHEQQHLFPPKSGKGFNKRSLKNSFGSSLLFFAAATPALPLSAWPTKPKPSHPPSPLPPPPSPLPPPSPARPVDSEGFGAFSSPLRSRWCWIRDKGFCAFKLGGEGVQGLCRTKCYNIWVWVVTCCRPLRVAALLLLMIRQRQRRQQRQQRSAQKAAVWVGLRYQHCGQGEGVACKGREGV